jgi:cation diffusion facilitator CzcD-associated flavoprotein CzcO
MPSWPGQDSFGGTVVHSRHYRNAKPFRGQRVLVVGMGNTGAEIALDLLEQGAKPALSVRSPVNVVPRDFLGQSTQESAMMLSKLPLPVADALGRFFQRLSIGDLAPYGLRKPPIAPAKQQREQGKTPVMDIGTVKAIKAGQIAVYPGLDRLEDHAAVFANGKQASFDAIVLATGYACAVEDFVDHAAPLLNQNGVPADCWFAERPGLCFLGFDGYSNGLLWSIHEDSGRIFTHLQDRAKKGHVSTRQTAGKA